MDLATLTLQEYTAGFRSQSNVVNSSNPSNDFSNRAVLRRCRTREQGIALLMVGHAIEYLIDSRLIRQQNTTGAEREALAILLRANLTVYNEGTEIKPFLVRLRHWFRGGGTAKREPANVSI